jgi:hypothetical protein
MNGLKNGAYTYKGILLNLKREGNSDIQYNIDEP